MYEAQQAEGLMERVKKSANSIYDMQKSCPRFHFLLSLTHMQYVASVQV